MSMPPLFLLAAVVNRYWSFVLSARSIIRTSGYKAVASFCAHYGYYGIKIYALQR